MPTDAFNICCPRDCVSRHNGGTSGAPLKPLRDVCALRALSSLRGLRGAPKVPPLCRETSVSWTANAGTVGKNGLMCKLVEVKWNSAQKPVLKWQKLEAETRGKCTFCEFIHFLSTWNYIIVWRIADFNTWISWTIVSNRIFHLYLNKIVFYSFWNQMFVLRPRSNK